MKGLHMAAKADSYPLLVAPLPTARPRPRYCAPHFDSQLVIKSVGEHPEDPGSSYGRWHTRRGRW